MKYFLVLLIAVILTSCQTANVKGNKYKVSDSFIELGCIGKETSLFEIKNEFEVISFPHLEKEIRLSVEILPLTKKLHKVYNSKSKYDQSIAQLEYKDSILQQPQFADIRILDISGVIDELNSDYNRGVRNQINILEGSSIVKSIAVFVKEEQILEIKNADAFYLSNNQEKKYSILLYKKGKRTGILDIASSPVIGYDTGGFCWAANERGSWLVGDIVSDGNKCVGKSVSKIKPKRAKNNLFKL